MHARSWRDMPRCRHCNRLYDDALPVAECLKCGHIWNTSSRYKWITCPACMSKSGRLVEKAESGG
jgi:Zn finger protein HypA/HybF involved in hydrogenase expression